MQVPTHSLTEYVCNLILLVWPLSEYTWQFGNRLLSTAGPMMNLFDLCYADSYLWFRLLHWSLTCKITKAKGNNRTWFWYLVGEVVYLNAVVINIILVCLYLSKRLLSSLFLAISRFIYLLSSPPGGFWDTLAAMLVEDYLWRETIALFAWRYFPLHVTFGLYKLFM